MKTHRGATEPTGRSEWMARMEARLAEHDRQLADHHARLSVVEERTQVMDAQTTHYACELDMLTRMSLRSARRLDRLSHAPGAQTKDR